MRPARLSTVGLSYANLVQHHCQLLTLEQDRIVSTWSSDTANATQTHHPLRYVLHPDSEVAKKCCNNVQAGGLLPNRVCRSAHCCSETAYQDHANHQATDRFQNREPVARYSLSPAQTSPYALSGQLVPSNHRLAA